MNKKWFFSLISGELYQIDEDEAKLLDDYQIALKCRPPTKCDKCYGRFFTSYYVTGRYYEVCKKCAKKTVDSDFFKNGKAHNK